MVKVLQLLLLTVSLVAASSNLHEILKSVGRRYTNEEVLEYYRKGEFNIYGIADPNALEWSDYSDERIANFKKGDARMVMKALAAANNAELHEFESSLLLIEELMADNLVVEICGDDKKMNGIQYIKYLRENSKQYKIGPYRNIQWTILDTDRWSLEMKMEVNQTDSFGLPVEMYFDVKMLIEVSGRKKTSVFRLKNIKQGGTCGETGKVKYTENSPMVDDPIEDLKNHPTAKLFLKLFTPPVYQAMEVNMDRLPRYWLSGLIENESKLKVCQEGAKETVDYSVTQFRSWYKHLGLMTRIKDTNDIGIQVIELKNDSIIARVTMKLLIGKDPTEHEYNFKFSAKVKEGENGARSWYIDQVETSCPVTGFRESVFKNYLDTVAGHFVNDVENLPPPSQWYSSVEFVKHFTKQGVVEFHYCDYDKVEKVSQLQMFLSNQGTKHNVKFLKYSIDNKNLPTPAPDTYQFHFKTISKADVPEKTEYEHEHEWKFDVKWDQMDQFYYIEKMEVGCERTMKDGEYADDNYLIFNFGGKK